MRRLTLTLLLLLAATTATAGGRKRGQVHLPDVSKKGVRDKY
jgi:predicted small lipoprotein YifL